MFVATDTPPKARRGPYFPPIAPLAGRARLDFTVCLAIPGRILEVIDEANRLARVDVAGVRRIVSLGLLDEAAAGDWVLIHVGFAISLVDEQAARETLALLERMGEAYEQELRDLRGSAIE